VEQLEPRRFIVHTFDSRVASCRDRRRRSEAGTVPVAARGNRLWSVARPGDSLLVVDPASIA
jgi:hypothetical protein